MELKDIKVGAPYLFKSSIYGDTAVHVTAIYNGIVHFTIDGGEVSRQVRDFPELSDGTYFAIPERIEKRAARLKRTRMAEMMRQAKQSPQFIEAAKGTVDEVQNTIREVPGVGKVAVVTSTPPALPSPEQLRALAAKVHAPLGTTTPPKRRQRRLSLTQALKEAVAMRSGARTTLDGNFNLSWPVVLPVTEEF